MSTENPQDSSLPGQTDGEANSPVPPDAPTNPLQGALGNVSVYVPPLEVWLVNASVLEDYEIWFGTASVCVAATCGFFAGFVSSTEPNTGGIGTHHNGALGWVTLVFLVLSVVGAWRTVALRKRLTAGSKKIELPVASAQPPT